MRVNISSFLDMVAEYAIYGLIFSIPISTSMIGIFAGIAIVSFLTRKILSPDIAGIKENKTFFLFILLFFAAMALSLFNSGPLLAKSLKALFIKWGRFPLLLWVIIDTFRDTKRIIKAMYVFLFSAALVGLTVFTQKFLGFEFLRGRASLGDSLPSIGPFKNQNGLAAYLTCVIYIVLGFGLGLWNNFSNVVNPKKIILKSSILLIIGLLISSSVWTFSRGGWLGLVVAFIFMILMVHYNRIRRWFTLIAILGIIFVVPLVTVVLYFSKPGRDANRFLLARAAWKMIEENPFLGKGIGTFIDYCAGYADNFGACYTHNCYLQIWAESGIFSLLGFLLLAGYVFYRSIKTCLGASLSLNFFILTGLTAGLLGYLVHSFFDIHLYSFQLSFLFWVVLGLTVALTQKMRTPAA